MNIFLLILAIAATVFVWIKFKNKSCLGTILKVITALAVVLLLISLVVSLIVPMIEARDEDEEARRIAKDTVDAFLEENSYYNYNFHLDEDEYRYNILVERVMEDPNYLDRYENTSNPFFWDNVYEDAMNAEENANGEEEDEEGFGNQFVGFLKKIFQFKFNWWCIAPLALGIVIAIVGAIWFDMDGDVAFGVIIIAAFISVIILAIVNWLLILSIVTSLALLAATGLTIGYLLPPAFKELPGLMREYSKPEYNNK